jgi:capsid protein
MPRVAHNKGIPASPQARANQSRAAGGRPFVSLLDGVVQEEFDTLRQAADRYVVNRSRIHEALNGLRKRVRGHSFQYMEN